MSEETSRIALGFKDELAFLIRVIGDIEFLVQLLSRGRFFVKHLNTQILSCLFASNLISVI